MPTHTYIQAGGSNRFATRQSKRLGGQHPATAAFPPPPRKTQYQLYKRLYGSQSRCGRHGKISHLDRRTVQPTASRSTNCLYSVPAQLTTSAVQMNLLSLQNKLVRFQAVTMVTTKLTVVWHVTPCNMVEIHRSFVEIYRLHLRCRIIPLNRKMEEMTYQNLRSNFIQNATNLHQTTRRHIVDDGDL